MENDLTGPKRRIYLFGAFQIQDEHGARPLSGEKIQSLLAYLTLHPRLPHSRERLADLLSPEASPERVRKNFSSNLYRLQKILGPGWLDLESGTIALRVDPSLWVDVWEFERLAASDRETDLQKAVDLYAGDLLPEIYADWFLAERELRRSQYLSALEKLAARLESRGELQGALLSTRRLILAEPLHEPAHQGYLRLLGMQRRYGEALAHYEYLKQLLQEELDAEPLAETQGIMQAIERERDLAAAPVAVVEGMTFVGRVSERAKGVLAVEAAISRHGGILAIEGEAGIGKSRLLQEILKGAHWRGAIVLQGGASEIPGGSPFAPLSDALSPMLHGPRGAQLESLLPPETLSSLAPLYSAWGKLAKLHHATFEQGGKQFDRALSVFSESLVQLGPVVQRCPMEEPGGAGSEFYKARCLNPAFLPPAGDPANTRLGVAPDLGSRRPDPNDHAAAPERRGSGSVGPRACERRSQAGARHDRRQPIPDWRVAERQNERGIPRKI
jgi:DNA-binding SARP family transcriptional activator